MEQPVLESRKTRSPLAFLLLLTTIVLFCCYFLDFQSWEDTVIQQPDGSYKLAKVREEAIARKVEKFETQTELYMLVAKTNAYYYCPACPIKSMKGGKYFLAKGQIYKYGVTINPKERYSTRELARWKLHYVILEVGNYKDMITREVILNGNYPILPENLARSSWRRLSIPPGSGVALR